jgi:hypothetical protein
MTSSVLVGHVQDFNFSFYGEQSFGSICNSAYSLLEFDFHFAHGVCFGILEMKRKTWHAKMTRYSKFFLGV